MPHTFRVHPYRGFGGQISFGRISSNHCPSLHLQDAATELSGNSKRRKARKSDKDDFLEYELEWGVGFAGAGISTARGVSRKPRGKC